MKKIFKGKTSTDRLLAIMAFVISASTLYVFFYQTTLMKKQQYASVLPYFSIGNTQVGGDYGFILQNNGIGPGFIDEISIHYKDTIYENSDINDFYNKVIAKNDSLLNSSNISHSTIRKGMLIPEKDTKYMVRLNREVKNFQLKHERLRDWLNNRIKVEIRYSSVYGEKWEIMYPNIVTPIKIN